MRAHKGSTSESRGLWASLHCTRVPSSLLRPGKPERSAAMPSLSQCPVRIAWKILGISVLCSLLVAGCTSSSGNSGSMIGPPAMVAITMQPSSVMGGGSITPAVQVSIEDAKGNVVTTATNMVTVAIGTNPSSGTLSGTLTVAAVSGVATFSNLSIDKPGMGYTLAASAMGLTGATSMPFNVFGTPTKVAFTAQPSNVASGASISPAVAVSIEDAQGSVVTTASNMVTVAIGTNPSGGTLSGTLTVAAVAGVATFSNLSIDKIGNGYTLSANATGLTAATSNMFNVVVGPPAKVVFSHQPSNVVAGNSITPAVAVTIEDSQGNVVTTATNMVTVAIGTNPSGGTLSGTLTVAAVAGVATFSNLSINKAGANYTLTASATGLTGATSNMFSVLVGTASQLAFTVQPSTVAAGVSITPAVAVSVEDNQGNVVTGATNTITVAISTNPAGGTLSGTSSVAAAAGVATFSNLSIIKAGMGYKLSASATGLTGATSTAFNVTAGAAAQLVFTVQPSNVVAGSSISPAVQVSIEDMFDNVTTATNMITVAIGTNPSSGTLSGTATASAVAGVATFSNLSINKAGTGYTLTAGATGLTGATSNTFNVTPGTATQLMFTVQPSNVVAGASITPAVAVSVEDNQGNVVTTATNMVTVAIGTNPSGGTLGGTLTVGAVAGVATFSNLSINKAGNGYTLTAGATGLTGTTSGMFNVTAGAATQLVFTKEPTNVVDNTSITPAVMVSVEDALGNVVTGATNTITVAISTNPASGTLSGTSMVAAVAGVATFSNLSINNVGNGYTLSASATGFTTITSTAFNVIVMVGPPAKLAFTVQPSNVVAGSSISPAVQVSVEDAGGNLVTGATNSITVAIGTNPSSGTLSGTLMVVASGGVATFSNLSINKAGNGYTLSASTTGGITGATSNPFNVTAGTAAKLGFTVQPSNVAAGASITPAVAVSVEDNQGNLVAGATNIITVAIGTNPSSGTLSGTLMVAASGGVATFSNLSINNAGNGYTLSASTTGGVITGATSNMFNVTAGTATQLVFTVEPSNVVAGSSISPAVQVSIEDMFGNVTTATSTVTVAIGTNPASGTLSGTLSVAAVAGVATFSNLSINNVGNGYTLTASVTGLTGATSTPFNVTMSVGPPTCPLPVLGNESLLNGTYSGLLNGWNDPMKHGGGPMQAAFAFAATGSTGAASTNITNGEADANEVRLGTTQVASQHVTNITGCFNLGADLRGLMIWNLPAGAGGGSIIFAIAVRADGTLGKLIQFNDATTTPPTTMGTRGAGHFEKSVGGITAVNGSVAFGLTAYAPNGSNPASGIHRAAFIGVITGPITLGGSAANGAADIAINSGGTQSNADNLAFTATFAVPDTLRRGTAILRFTSVPGIGALTLNYAYYVGGMEGGTLHIKLQSTDTPDNAGHTINNGELIVQTGGPFGPGSLSGNAVFQMSGNALMSSGSTPMSTDVAAGLITGGGTQVYLDEVKDGAQTSVGTSTISGGAFTASANGLGSVTFGPSPGRAFSVAMIAPNAGFILEGTQANTPTNTGHILTGDFGPQTVPAGGFTNTQFSGLYIVATDHPSDPSVDDIVGSGTASPTALPSPTFDGKVDDSGTGGLAADQLLAATYGVDARGRNVVPLTSPGTDTAIAWLRDTNNAEIISQTTGTSLANAAILRAHGGGGAVGAAGGNASISAPPSGAATLVVSGVAGARTTLTLAASIVPAAGDNGAGINWFVDTASADLNVGACTSTNPVQGGSGASGNGSITMHTTTGGAATYTAPTAVPGTGNFILICAQQPGTGGMAAGAFSVAFFVAIAPSNNAIPTTSAFNLINGASSPVPFVMRIRGFNTSSGRAFAIVGRFAMDGIGSATSADGTGITNGLLDVNIAHADGSSSSFVKVPFTGGYHMDDSNHGTAKFVITPPVPWASIADALPSTLNFSFELDVIGAFFDPVETDANFTSTGEFQPQDPFTSDFSTNVITGPYTFSLNGPAGDGTALTAVQKGIVGRLDLSTGTIVNTSTSDDQGGNGGAAHSLSGTYTIDDAVNGHGSLTVTVAGQVGTPVVSFYVGPSANVLFALETDQNAPSSGRGILVGAVRANAGTFDNTSLGGPNSFALQGITPSTAANGQGHVSVAIGVFTGTPTTAGNGTLTGVTVFNDGGTVAGPVAFNNSSTYTIDARGRGFLHVSLTVGGTTTTYNFVFYLIQPAFGFFQEQQASDGSNRGRSSFLGATGITPPFTASGVGNNTVWVAGMEIATAAGANAVDAFTLNGGADNSGTYQNAVNTMSGTFTVTDQTNGLGTLTPAGGTKFFGNATAAFVVEPSSAEIEIIGTDSTNHEPQIIFLDQ